jgi:hypothetical protein
MGEEQGRTRPAEVVVGDVNTIRGQGDGHGVGT